MSGSHYQGEKTFKKDTTIAVNKEITPLTFQRYGHQKDACTFDSSFLKLHYWIRISWISDSLYYSGKDCPASLLNTFCRITSSFQNWKWEAERTWVHTPSLRMRIWETSRLRFERRCLAEMGFGRGLGTSMLTIVWRSPDKGGRRRWIWPSIAHHSSGLLLLMVNALVLVLINCSQHNRDWWWSQNSTSSWKKLPKKMSETQCSNHEHAFPSLFSLNALTIKMQKMYNYNGYRVYLAWIQEEETHRSLPQGEHPFFLWKIPQSYPVVTSWSTKSNQRKKKLKNPPGFTFKALLKTVWSIDCWRTL